MIYRWNGFRFPPEDKKLDRALVILIVLLLFLWSCSYNPYPSSTKIKYETETNTTDKTSGSDTAKDGNKWTFEQTFRWKTRE